MEEKVKAEKLVEKALGPGEEICWRGEGVPFKLVEKDSRKSFVRRLLVGGFGVIVMMGSCLLNNDGKWGFPALISALLLLTLLLAIHPI